MRLFGFCPLVLFFAATIGCQKEDATAVAPAPASPAVEVVVEHESDAVEATQEFVIDVRSQEEWDTGHLGQAVHIPHEEISDRIAEVTEDKSAKLVLY